MRSQTRRDERTARGLGPSPIKVTVTERVELDACADFFTTGEAEKLVYCPSSRVEDARSRLGPVATVVERDERTTGGKGLIRREELQIRGGRPTVQ